MKKYYVYTIYTLVLISIYKMCLSNYVQENMINGYTFYSDYSKIRLEVIY